ncbi:MAG: hypothetical protein G3M70_06990 [Candidatus Nitronauta litoralis]|uniref:Uncharacterized protein n=1 Tax=Candidatus Nitronauta litoralis TaxID=2705533 RepID=A0A7T0BWA6_9BACT|nr:MAG: hypothetical protein G3M70_06990 [Candidatus Nitronauta litoralis]
MLQIDIRLWHREGWLTAHQNFRVTWSRGGEVRNNIEVHVKDNHVILNYKHRQSGDEWKKESYPVYLDWTHCNYGGKRPWFLCPVQGCRRRVAILYSAGIFACRQCNQVLYTSQMENEMDRATGRADKIRDRLGWEPGILNGNGLKPRGMHWRTFERLSAEHDFYVNQSLLGATLKFKVPMDYFG